MNFNLTYKKTLLILLLSFFSLQTWATNFNYQADVEGMVCAFCVYNVSKKIRQLAGIDANSVMVSLEGNFAKFSADRKISEEKLSSLFSQSGFKLTHLKLIPPATQAPSRSKQARLDVKIDVFETDQFTSLISRIGDIAAKTPSRIRIEAPQEQEESILKPLLIGRQEAIQVEFISNDATDLVHLQLFSNSD